jgi:Heparinase II/III-like protein/Heparinase II/III N-terminus
MRLLGSMKRALEVPPQVLARRIRREVVGELERVLPPGAGEDERAWLLRKTESTSLDALWERIGASTYPASRQVAISACDELCVGGRSRIVEAAERARRHEVQLLGSPVVALGEAIDWHRDYKSGVRWAPQFHRDIAYHDLDSPSDVKFPWEVSRFHWLLPAAQAYRLTGDDSYARAARDVLDDWISGNAYGMGVNWACAMEVALRIVSWTWMAHAFHRSEAWKDDAFRLRFLRSLFLQTLFVERHLEESDLNSNHYLADAAGLVFGGLFFEGGAGPRRWSRLGWSILCKEAPLQVLPDGVDYEGSIAYHRLVMECLLYPALYRRVRSLDVPAEYANRLARMSRFVSAYSKPDGTSPLVGDADDGRVLPLGGQPLLDHRYLVGLVAAEWRAPDLLEGFSGPRDEIYWTLGAAAAQTLPTTPSTPRPQSAAFEEGGYFVMRTQDDHVFIDCGPVGLAGRGGHGHNDCLSFEAVLAGVPLVIDSGTFTYTASFAERNRFRATAAHNTTRVDLREINRFIGPRMLWSLANDARPVVHRWTTGPERDVFRGSHGAYGRLPEPVTVSRTLVLDRGSHALAIEDVMTGAGRHRVEIPLHFDPGVEISPVAEGYARLSGGGKTFRLLWESDGRWDVKLHRNRISPSYGVALDAPCLRWTIVSEVPVSLRTFIAPEPVDEAVLARCRQWLTSP